MQSKNKLKYSLKIFFYFLIILQFYSFLNCNLFYFSLINSLWMSFEWRIFPKLIEQFVKY